MQLTHGEHGDNKLLRGEEPLISGKFSFEIQRAPVSLQSKAKRKEEFKEVVFKKIENAQYFLSGDISITIEWTIHEQKRYESNRAADVDNIVKPLLDALVGINGIMVDDNQVQSIQCYWINGYDIDKETLKVTVQYSPDDFIPKEGLYFVEFPHGLCLPLWKNYDIDEQAKFLQTYENMLSARDKAMDEGMDYYSCKTFMPVQRVFHKMRLQEFNIEKLADVRRQLSS